MTLFSVLLGMLMLGCPGYVLARHVAPRGLHLALALPLGALVHALMLAGLTLLSISLSAWILLTLHITILVALLIIPVQHRPEWPVVAAEPITKHRTLLHALLITLLAAQALYAATHAVILPTYSIDSFTNWTMRAKVSWLDHELAFDPTETRGVAKPQYPFLVHGVQMAANIVAPQWSDRSANTGTLALTVSSLAALFLLLRRLRGTTTALLALTLITHIPLLSFHLAQGYGDIHLITYLLLSLGFMIAARITSDTRWLVLSALTVAASAWTKTEGAIIGLLPWVILVAIDLPWLQGRRMRIGALTLCIVVALLFPLFLMLKGLPFTPHDSDNALGYQTGSFVPALLGFFSASMGLTWPAIVVGLAALVYLWKRNDPRVDCRLIITLGWGILGLLIVFVTYTFTPNARFLDNGESYFRQPMIPAALLILSLVASLQPRSSDKPVTRA